MTRSQNPDLHSPTSREEELAAWLRLNLTNGLGPAGTLNLLRALGTPEQVLAASHVAVSRVVGAALATRLLAPDDEIDTAIGAALRWAGEPANHLVCLTDPAYPARLFEIGDPPPLLFVSGNLAALDAPTVGIVGSRHATLSGLDNARAFASELARQGLNIASGLARGIDTAAHEGALQAQAPTVAVMGTGIDRIYPAANRSLAARIVTDGALVSELPLGTAATRGNFPRRNRLIAGLSLGVLVVEAARHSGSLITARQASEFGREVFAIPGSIHSPVSRGCHQLIRQGAKLVESVGDVLSELKPLLSSALVQSTSVPPARAPGEQATQPTDGAGGTPDLLAKIAWDPVTIDGLLPVGAGPGQAAQLARELLEMELAGRIERLSDGRVRRRAGA